MSKPMKPRRPKTEQELRDAQAAIDNLQQDRTKYKDSPVMQKVIANLQKQQEQRAANRRQEMAQADQFATRLRRLRQERGLTQVELAERAGVGQAMVSLLEKGDRLPSWPAVCRLAEALGVGVEAFRSGSAAELPGGAGV